MKNILFLIGLALLVSCNKELTFEFKEIKNNPCNDGYNCAHVQLDVVLAKNKGVVADSINTYLFNATKNLMYFDEEQPDTISTYEGLLKKFTKVYTQTKKELEVENFMAWEFTCQQSIYFQSDRIINLKLEHYQFTGGAHGYGAVQSIVVDAKTGKKLGFDKLFTDVEAVKNMAENKFRIQYEIPFGKSLNEYGFFFEKDKFSLPQNIFFADDKVVLHYNQYEIAPYAFGPIEIILDHKEVHKYLTVNQFQN
jgi:hypothetical protein